MKRIIYPVLAFAAVIALIAISLQKQNHTEQDLERPENPIERQRWRLMQKGGPVDPVKLKALRNDLNAKVAAQSKRNSRDAGLANWDFRGPDNIGGRVRAIAIHPNDPDLIYVGSAGGGMWRSENAGDNWEMVDDFLPSLAITSIIFNPRDPDIMYASTGEGQASVIGMPGAGIYKSENTGDTWTLLSSTETFNWVNKIAIHPQNDNTLFAATSAGGSNGPNGGNFYKSTDSGVTWTQPVIGGLTWTDIDIHPDDPNLITASGSPGYARSVDGGATFTYELGATGGLPLGSRRIEIAMWPKDTRAMYALMHTDSTNAANPNRCKLYFSDDEGDTWDLRFQDINSVFPSNGFGDYSNTIWVDPLNEKHVLFGGVDLWESTDGGFTASPITDWKNYHNRENDDDFSLHADHHIIVESPDYQSGNQLVYFGNDGGIQRTKDLSSVTIYSGWENLLNKQMGITQFYSGAVAPDESVFGGGAQDNSFSTGLGNNTAWRQRITGDGAYMAINYDNPNIIYANTNYNKLWKSTDKGDTWLEATYLVAPPNQLQIPIDLESDGANLISPFIMDPDDPDILYLGAEKLWKYDANTLILESIKNGLSSATVTSIAAADDGDYLWVGYSSGSLQFSTSGGNGWSQNVSPLAGSAEFVTDIDIKPDLSQVIVTYAGYNQTNIWKYTVSSGVWTNISLDVDLQVNCVTHNPLISNWIYAGTDLGIFSSEDNGNTWSSTPLYGPPGTTLGNDGPIFTEVTALFWSGTLNGVAPHAKLWASTFGRGLWSSNWVLGKIYVNRSFGSDVTGNGTMINPYKTLDRAADEAGSGSTIVFQQGSNHEESPSPSILLDKRVKFELRNGAVIIK